MNKMTKQRLLGLAFIAICVLIVAFAMQGTTVEDRDITPVLLFLPLGIYALITKKYILYDSDAEAREEPEKEPEDICPGCQYNTNDYIYHPHYGGYDGKNKFEKGATSWHENTL